MQTNEIQPGDILDVELIISGWSLPGSALILDVETIRGRRHFVMIAAQGSDPGSSNHWMYARGVADGGAVINHVEGGNGLNAVRVIRKTCERTSEDIAYSLGQAKGDLNRRFGPIGDGPVGDEGFMALRSISRRIEDCREEIEEAEEERDELVRRMIEGGVPVQELANRLGLSRARIYQIRDGRR